MMGLSVHFAHAAECEEKREVKTYWLQNIWPEQLFRWSCYQPKCRRLWVEQGLGKDGVAIHWDVEKHKSRLEHGKFAMPIWPPSREGERVVRIWGMAERCWLPAANKLIRDKKNYCWGSQSGGQIGENFCFFICKVGIITLSVYWRKYHISNN